MERLRNRDVFMLLGFLKECYGTLDPESFAPRTLSKLSQLIPSHFVSYSEINPRKGQWKAIEYPPLGVSPAVREAGRQYIHQHPSLADFIRNPRKRIYKISDYLTQSEWHRLALYNEGFRVIGIEEEMAFAISSPDSLVTAFSFARDRRNFTERERLMLKLLRPHLAQAYENVKAVAEMQKEAALLKPVMEKLGLGVITLTRDGHVQFADARAEQLMKIYFGNRALHASSLPEELQRWTGFQESCLKLKDDVPPAREPLILERQGRRLVVRLISDPNQSLLILKEELKEIQPESLGPLGLTRREAEVLVWLSYGKTNTEIGTILGTSPQTVKKHLDHIYQKLGVETRTAAAARALEIASLNNL